MHEREVDHTLATLEMLAAIQHEGQAVDQLTHALQTATRLRRGGADPDLVVAGLLHDIGKLWHEERHAGIAVTILSGRVRPEVTGALLFHPEARSGELEPATEDARQLLAADAASVDDAAYEADTLESFRPWLAKVFCG